MVEKTYTVVAEEGIHARPATILVKKASEYTSDIQIDYQDKQVNVKSIMGIMSLGIPVNATFRLLIEGNDEEEALQGISTLMEVEGIAK